MWQSLQGCNLGKKLVIPSNSTWCLIQVHKSKIKILQVFKKELPVASWNVRAVLDVKGSMMTAKQGYDTGLVTNERSSGGHVNFKSTECVWLHFRRSMRPMKLWIVLC